MRRYISGTQFDSRLSVGNVGPNHHADLTIIARIAMHEYFPGHNFRLDRWLGLTGGRATWRGQEMTFVTENGVEIALTTWPEGEFGPFCDRYKEALETGWNNKLWLVPAGIWRGAPAGSNNVRVPAVRCSLRVELVSSNEHVHCDVTHLALPSANRTSSTPTVVSRTLADFLCLDEFTRAGRLKADNHDLNPKPGYGQIAAMHEMGHYLGLSHVNGDTNDIEAYGVTEYQRRSLMGHGTEIRPAHAWPWKRRLMLHSHSASHLRWHAVTSRPRPQLIRNYPTRSPSGADDRHGAPTLDGGVAATGGTAGGRTPGATGRYS